MSFREEDTVFFVPGTAAREQKIWFVGSLRMRQHPSKVFLVLFVHKENSTLREQ